MKVKVIPFAEAVTALKDADAKLQAAKSPVEKRAAAIAFANAERVALSAKKRETEHAVSSILDTPAAKGK